MHRVYGSHPELAIVTSRLLAVVAVVSLTGCVNPPEAGTSEPSTPSLGRLSDWSAVVDPDRGHGEPSLGVAPDGTLYTNGRNGPPGVQNSGGVGRRGAGAGAQTSASPAYWSHTQTHPAGWSI